MGQPNEGFTSAWVICECKGSWKAQAGMGSQGNTSQLQSGFCCEFKSLWHNFPVYHRSDLTDDLWRFPWDHWQVCLIRGKDSVEAERGMTPSVSVKFLSLHQLHFTKGLGGKLHLRHSGCTGSFSLLVFMSISRLIWQEYCQAMWTEKVGFFILKYYGSVLWQNGCRPRSGWHTSQTSKKMDRFLRLDRVKVYAWEKGAASKGSQEVSWDCDHLTRSSLHCISFPASFPH